MARQALSGDAAADEGLMVLVSASERALWTESRRRADRLTPGSPGLSVIRPAECSEPLQVEA